MNQTLVSFDSNGKTYQGYLAKSITDSGPGIILIQEWWGLVGHITDVADRLASEGFTVLAPDFYDGKATTDPDEAGSLMMALNIEAAEQTLHGAIQFLLDLDATVGDKVGVMGFCMGGQLALYAAAVDPLVAACVDFYGIHPNVSPPLENLHAPVLGIFAEHDAYASPAAVSSLDAVLSKLKKNHQFVTYPGTQHAFFNDQRPQVYDPVASADAWRRTLEFLRLNL